MSHTPGPWEPEGPRVYTSGKGATLIATTGHLRDSDQEKANARLIAAAPDLYEACNGLVGLCALLLANDLPANVREALESNHRVIAAKEALAKVES